MFEAALKSDLLEIFGLKKASYDFVSFSKEQECIFIDIEKSNATAGQGASKARVEGIIKIFGNSAKLPFGFFAKRISMADPELSSKFFFYDTEQSNPITNNIVERSASFIYFYSSQYNPIAGKITSIEVDVNEV